MHSNFADLLKSSLTKLITILQRINILATVIKPVGIRIKNLASTGNIAI